jgi:hypothetical protein
VKALFTEFEGLKADGSDEEKAMLVAQICNELVAHATIEDRTRCYPTEALSVYVRRKVAARLSSFTSACLNLAERSRARGVGVLD